MEQIGGCGILGQITNFVNPTKKGLANVYVEQLSLTVECFIPPDKRQNAKVGDHVMYFVCEYRVVEKTWDATANNGRGALVNKLDINGQFIPTGEMFPRNDIAFIGTKEYMDSITNAGQELQAEVDRRLAALRSGKPQ
ncbi:MAG: hypothetical protein K9G49_04365 [Taibaiella sp.]|nr:hypothetical protein [Taibaiella sp.]